MLHGILCRPKFLSSHLDLVVAAEAVKLVEQFKHGPLHLPVPRLLSSEPLCADRVQLVDEDDSPALKKHTCRGHCLASRNNPQDWREGERLTAAAKGFCDKGLPDDVDHETLIRQAKAGLKNS